MIIQMISNEHSPRELEILVTQMLLERYFEDSRLTIELIIKAIVGVSLTGEARQKVLDDYERVDEGIKQFEREVWLQGGWQEDEHRSALNGLSLVLGDIEALSFSTAGRTLITIRDKNKGIDITMCTAEDDPPYPDGSGHMGLQSIYATADEALALLHQMGQYCELGLCMGPSRDVSIGITDVTSTIVDTAPQISISSVKIPRRLT